MAGAWAKNDISWYLVKPGDQLDRFLSADSTSYRIIIEDAFDTWSSVADLSFWEVQDPAAADIVFGWWTMDGIGQVAGTATTFSDAKGNIYHSDIRIDADDFDSSFVSRPSLFYQLSVHEIGHALGADHSDDPASLMYPTLYRDATLTTNDVQTMQSLYGPLKAPLSASATSSLFDGEYYLSRYPDVYLAGMDPKHHFDVFGFKELRDPNALFDTRLYLSANPDVLEAGVNPLDHYLDYGASEGRDPHSLFDTDFYLLKNEDVRQAEVNPLEHWLSWGADEGRDPNAYFDTEFYLAMNPDVASNGINPLVHYDNYGWEEGRDPSSDFSSSGYLNKYEDVAAADINPLAHYLEYGMHEGRDDFMFA